MSREKANARERCRQKSIGNAFNVLRNHLPKQLRDRKPSKAETLKSATQYILHLLQILDAELNGESGNIIKQHVANSFTVSTNDVGYQKGVWNPPECMHACDSHQPMNQIL
ncbi:hypothetical protein L5515_016083 [Caenorhabditis briggsae]|uniref:BHLH domain-containing protein n=1 Tax=Caenorhabditis briggsae TaxID=6238 RepID=A0AAE9FAC7_CAEBR|nr:hypothetical protein L5515_016083 [Caenorhabditis briggsae]